MVQFRGGKFDLPMDQFHIDGFDIIGSDVLSLSDTQFTVDSDDDRSQVYVGTGFVDNNADDIPDSGTITGWTQNFHGKLFVDWRDMNMSWEDYWNYVTTNDTDGFLHAVFDGKDTFRVGKGDDVLWSFGGNDVVNAGAGDDIVDAGAGRDKIIGGAGSDTLTGGTGADKFRFNKVSDSPASGTPDIITDFNGAEGDRIDLHAIDADTTHSGNQAFHFGGTEFNGEAGELIIFDDGSGNGIVQGDINGNGTADFAMFVLEAVPTVETLDF